MTIATPSLTTLRAPHASPRPARFTDTLAAEWSKLATLRSTHLTLGLGVALSIGTSALVCLALGSTQESWPVDVSPVTTSMIGNIWALIVTSVFGALVMAREYSGGLIRLTLAATPRRGHVLAAKLLLTGLITLVFGLLTTAGMFLIGQAILGAYGQPVANLGDADARRMVLGLGMTMPVFPLLGAALGALLRSTAGAITAVLGLLWLPQIIGQFLPRWWQEHVISLLPGSAVDSITLGHVESSFSYSSPAAGVVITGLWLIAFVGAAYLALVQRDA